MTRRWIIGVAMVVGVIASVQSVAATEPTNIDTSKYSSLRKEVSKVKMPPIDQPKWLKKQIADEKAAAAKAAGAKRATGGGIIVTYDVTTKGQISANFTEFKRQANQTLNDNRGWSRLNVRFQEVASGGRFTLVLAEASQLPTYSSGCSADYSCRAGRFVIINQDRWQGATPSWNSAGGSLRDYRHMVVNHETGHWLGHDHRSCGGSGQPAPLMQQQSMDLRGCSFNPWPLSSELYSPMLGIT